MNILIIDDNHDLADGLGMVLEDEGYQVSIAYTGVDAIKIFDTGEFDSVFIDVKLPDINGVEIFQYIHNKKPDVKTIMMTGYRIEQVMAEIINNADVEILRKPFEIEHILGTLKQVRNESILLLAGDDRDFVDGMSEILTELGLKTILARNGQEALDAALSKPIDVLVLDLQRPIMCGLEVYLKLKKQGIVVKTIIVTGPAKQESETIDVLKSMSVTGCLFKPFNPEDMLNAIEKLNA